MRKIKTLLKSMIDNKELFCTGLCNLNSIMFRTGIINYREFKVLEKFIDDHPTQRYLDGSLYYWPISLWEPRLAWLYEQISKL